ncbi:MAG: hypothetical protein GY713_18040 [Actinomycetia bacterium]|nr:hypothetical protein [Actinomycetes bacterium]
MDLGELRWIPEGGDAGMGLTPPRATPKWAVAASWRIFLAAGAVVVGLAACSDDGFESRVAGTHQAVLLGEPLPWPDDDTIPYMPGGLRVEVVEGRPEGVLDPSVVVVRFDSAELSCQSGRPLEFEDLAAGTSLTFEQIILGDVFTAAYPPSVSARSVRIDC